MKICSSTKIARVVVNVTTDASPSENSLFDRSLSASTVLPSTPNNDISTTDKNVREQLQIIADQSLSPDVNKNEESVSKTTENHYKRKEALTKLHHKSKATKTSGDSMVASSSISIDEVGKNDNKNHPQSSTSVWKYATRSHDKKHAICLICGTQITTSNWSTSALRRHLILKGIRIILLHEFRLGHKATKAAKNICNTTGPGALSIRTAQHWFDRFRNGNYELDDQPRRGRPIEVDIDLLKQQIEQDPRLTTRALAALLGCSHITLEKHLADFCKSWKYGIWIPHKLSPYQLQSRVNTCMHLITSHRNYQ
ncbi:unnamed protein product [Adineta ricciae]|uniref:BED-type domain-containing protein n=1 Tax=Adineta ricciae TaxID=249248 RepID=A0A814VN73_ADIRI|nr:unnamed protein product [Adineta ricciae]